MRESRVIHFLYRTIAGRTILKVLVNPKLSQAAAKFLCSGFSRWLVPLFVEKNKINMDYYKIPKGGYPSFNDFFTRRMKEKYITRTGDELICPCDGLLTVSGIDEHLVFHIKHTEYSVTELLQDEKLATDMKGGTAFIFRLTPANYHRYLFCTTGFLLAEKKINGILHSVQPICHEVEKVFVQNTREYILMNSDDLGKVVQMEIGALLVGKITNYPLENKEPICGGTEKGYFEYGGSSIVILVKEKVRLSEEIKGRYKIGSEIPVMIGENLIETI